MTWVELKINQARDKVVCPCGETFENRLSGIRQGQKHIADGQCAAGEPEEVAPDGR